MADVDASGNVIDNRRYVVDASGNSLECVDVSGSVVEHVGGSDEIEIPKCSFGKFVSKTKWVGPDGIASIELLDYMGSDIDPVNAARVSFGKEVKEILPRDEKLIKYLTEHDHISPFFHNYFRFRFKMPIYVVREWYRHGISFSRSEISRRYVDSDPEFFIPEKSEMRERNVNLKQGSKDTPVDPDSGAYEIYKEISEKTGEAYKKLLELKVAPELCRGVLSQNMYTEFIESASLYGYARLFNLRSGEGAQLEIKRYAEVVGLMIQELFPVSWKNLTKKEK
jgi:thymidylate synthase (FAD)